MKRMVLIAALLLGTGLNAHADTVTYHNILKPPRNDDQLHRTVTIATRRSDRTGTACRRRRLTNNACSAAAGAISPSSASRRRKTWIDSDTGLTCHEILDGFGSECSNF